MGWQSLRRCVDCPGVVLPNVEERYRENVLVVIGVFRGLRKLYRTPRVFSAAFSGFEPFYFRHHIASLGFSLLLGGLRPIKIVQYNKFVHKNVSVDSFLFLVKYSIVNHKITGWSKIIRYIIKQNN